MKASSCSCIHVVELIYLLPGQSHTPNSCDEKQIRYGEEGEDYCNIIPLLVYLGPTNLSPLK